MAYKPAQTIKAADFKAMLKSGEIRVRGSKSNEKAAIQKTLHELGFKFETEYRFHPIRKWKFDWAIPSLKVAVEYEGIMAQKSRHTTVSGFTKDTEKYNAAQILGWVVLRYTTINHKQLKDDLLAITERRSIKAKKS